MRINTYLVNLIFISVAASAQSLPVLVPFEKPSAAHLAALNYAPPQHACDPSNPTAQSAIWGYSLNPVPNKPNQFTTSPLVTHFTAHKFTWTISPFRICLNATIADLTGAIAQANTTVIKAGTLTVIYKALGTGASFDFTVVNPESYLPATLKNPQGKTVTFVGCADDRDNPNVLICCYSPNGTTTSCNF